MPALEHLKLDILRILKISEKIFKKTFLETKTIHCWNKELFNKVKLFHGCKIVNHVIAIFKENVLNIFYGRKFWICKKILNIVLFFFKSV